MSNFEVFKNEFQGDIVVPTDEDYAAAITRWVTSAERKAKVVAFVKESQDVARAIKYAKANHLPIAVRGGGHNPSGASSEDGLVIDLTRYINTITVDPDNRLADVGGGAMWSEPWIKQPCNMGWRLLPQQNLVFVSPPILQVD